MLLQPAPIQPSLPLPLPLSRYPSSPLSPPFLPPLRSSSLSLLPSALSRRGRSPLNRRRQPDSTDDAPRRLDEEIEDYHEALEERKPRGFVAEGIKYDTSLEERLLKEIQRSSKDPVVNLSKVKDKKEHSKKKGVKVKKTQDRAVNNASNKMGTFTALDAPTTGIRVRLWNLPKKKNIHRDLKTAFEGFRGILDINPAISGNKKTRDPVCKGFAFVDLATNEAANRFVETFSKRRISFGRVEKQIGCCIVNPNANPNFISPNTNPTIMKFSNNQTSQMLEPQFHDGFLGVSENTNPLDGSPIIFVEEDEEEEDPSSSLEEDEEEDPLSSFEIMEDDDDEADEDNSDLESTTVALGERKKAVGLRRRRVRPRRANSSRLSFPLRLKGRERDVLSGVFSKYSSNSEATQPRKS